MSKICLTFDNGPDPSTTPRVLEELRARGIRATFHVTGTAVARHRELAEEAARDGHLIGNHSLTHALPLGDDPDPAHAVAEIERAEELIGGLAGSPPLFRPFGGGGRIGPHLLCGAAVDHLRRHGYTVALWNSVPRDWEHPTEWIERALADIRALDWTVLVLHDLPTGAMDHLPRFLDQVGDAEYTQEMPDACVPMRAGVATPALAEVVR